MLYSKCNKLKINDWIPPLKINNGIIIKKIINIPWKVIKELYWKEEQRRNPGKAISTLIMIDIAIPKDPPIIPEHIYTDPIKIWFVEKKQE